MHFSGSFGSWLKQQRKLHDWTQAQLAEKVGCSVALIRKYEADERRPSKQIATIFADLFSLPTGVRDEFLAYARGAEFSVAVVRNNLPSDQTPFIGRASELELLRKRLMAPECRLLVLTGLGGIGKTRLAIQAGRDVQHLFSDGVFFLSLLGVDSPDYLLSSLASVLSLSFHSTVELKAQLLQHLHTQKLLLVIDNYEHLLPRTDLITEILDGAPNLKIMITSRERLKIQEEWGFPVKGLAYPTNSTSHYADFDTVQLFEQRAAQADSHFKLTETNQPHIVRICELVQGSPLAIELAASWTRLLTCQEIADAIHSNWEFLSKEARNVPERHQGMSAVFEYSWHRLSPAERTGFMKLSVFRGGFTQEAALNVAEVSLSVLASLMDRSFIVRNANGRYEIHELLRRYGETKLTDLPDELSRTQTAVITYYATLLNALRADMWYAGHKQAIAQIKAEIDNIRHAWTLAYRNNNWEFFMRAVEPMWHYYNDSNLFEEGITLINQSLAHLAPLAHEPLHEFVLAILYHIPSSFVWRLGRLSEAKELVDQSLAYLQSSGLHDVRHEILIKGSAFQIALARNELTEAKYHAEICLVLGQQHEDELSLAAGHLFLGTLARIDGNIQSAKSHFRESLQFAERIKSQRTLAYCLYELAQVEAAEQNLAVAQTLFERSIDLYSLFDDIANAAGALLMLGKLHVEMDNTSRAAVAFYDTLQKSHTIHALPLTVSALTEIALLLVDVRELTIAGEILRAVYAHPAVTQESRTRIESIRSHNADVLTLPLLAEQAVSNDLDEVISLALHAEKLLH